MTPADPLERSLAELSGRIERLDATLAALRADRQGDNADDEHDPEGATLSAEWSRLSGLRADAERERREVESAIERRTAGAYGICADCGRPIPLERLQARPTATRCVVCAST
ncbi:TraR/DksA C4-type zinc finger protein [Microbacterium sp. SLBN-146]|uniref:TraR/DksA family transcriptional regulator n=1 Tax=Microbacterium sp. SLBN-146 TaxID=2768457 RepID=UPI0011530E53|nr:TraR/DksA C4-type zinc finger protein [Microbacterium sp. SLBN-146]TQJ32330.1 TraR/DksA family transcriptional regulator [Microbacterium sp. SLBN-146]